MSVAEVDTAVDLGFKIPRGVLFQLLSKAVAVVPTSDNLDVLKHFQVRVGEGKIEVASTDTQLSVVAVSDQVEVVTEGMAVFPASRLLGLVKEATDGDIGVTVAGREADIRSGHTTWSLKLSDPEDFPDLPVFDEMDFAPISRTDLVAALWATRSAVSRDAMRPNLNIVSVNDGTFESSDGVRYHRVTVESKLGAVQIPANALDDLVTLLAGSSAGEVEVGQDENMVCFRLGEDVYTAQKLVAKFPDMEKAILNPAKGNSLELTVDRLELIGAVRRVRVTSDEETSAITLELSDGTLSALSQDKFGSWSREDLTVGWDEIDLEITVNHRHLLDALEIVSADTVKIMLGKGTKTRPAPVLIRAGDHYALAVLSQLRREFVG